jgi:hypothetical protein
MEPEFTALLRKLHAYHVTNLNLLSRLAARKVELGSKEGDRIADFIMRELEQISLISTAMMSPLDCSKETTDQPSAFHVSNRLAS